jgi:perosamine synthetase
MREFDRPKSMNVRTVPLSQPSFHGSEWEYLKDCLDSGWVSSAGRYVEQFEKMVSEVAHKKFAIATVNGTSALHSALLAAGVKQDEEVIVSTLTFIASANAISYTGAHPVFIDAEPLFCQMDISIIEKFLGSCKTASGKLFNPVTNRRIAAIMPVHVLGHPVETQRLKKLAQTYDIPVVEDASEALGSRDSGMPVGSQGLASCYSFNGNKILTCGGGGMVATDDPDFAFRIRHLTTQAKTSKFEYIHDEVGYNYRLTNLQAAVGCAQMETLDSVLARKRQIADRYAKLLQETPGMKLPDERNGAQSNWWLYTVLNVAKPHKSEAIVRRLSERGVQTRRLWQPLHLSKPHRKCQTLGGNVAESIYDQAISLPSSVSLQADEQEWVARCLHDIVRTL